MLREIDRKIGKNKQRADEENAPAHITEDQQRMMDDLAVKIKEALEKSQKLGEQGKVEDSLHSAQEAEKYRMERENLEKRFKYPSGRIMFVCEVCGVFINSTDNEARRADHYNGKQYLGWKAIREKLKQIENKVTSIHNKTQSQVSTRDYTCKLRQNSRSRCSEGQQRTTSSIRRVASRSVHENHNNHRSKGYKNMSGCSTTIVHENCNSRNVRSNRSRARFRSKNNVDHKTDC